MKSQLAAFVHEALARGIDRASITKVLQDAGWPEADIRAALNTFSEAAFPVPVPRPKPSLSARETFAYLVVFTAFYSSVWNVVQLIFELIERALPDPLSTASLQYSNDAIRWHVSALVITFPLFVFSFRATRRALSKDPTKRHSPVRKWLTYLTLFIAVFSLSGSLVSLVYNLLGGELTLRFLLKFATVVLIAGGTLGYFYGDMRKEEKA